MKKHQFNQVLFFLLVGGLASCNPLKKMAADAENVKYTVAPDPLELHADSINMAITGKIPAEYFHKKAIIDVTPLLKTKGVNGEVVKEFKTITLVGEAATEEGQKITQASGGSFNYTDKVAYKDAMESAVLEVKIVGRFKTKSVDIGNFKVGDGTIITPTLVMSDEKPILGTDKFVKVTPRKFEAQLNYVVNSSQVRGSELLDEDYKGLKEFLSMGAEKEFVFKGVKISAYASPDGEISKNENLANDRAASAKKAFARDLKKAKIEIENPDEFYTLEGKGEDWEGFKTKMVASDIEDKDLILRVLKMYTDLDQREKEIKNLAATYTAVADKILPELRRSMISVMADEMSRTDEEIQRLVKSAPDSLSIEEILYAATLTESLDDKQSVYASAKKVYPSDWRGHNNSGYVLLLQNKANDAKADFEAALNADANNKIASNNLAICHKLSGDFAKAKELYTAAKGAGKEVSYNLGILDIIGGKYSSAVANMGSEKTFNAALATLLNGNANGAIAILDASGDKEMAMSYYLKAIAGARAGNKDLTINNLKTAISKDSSLKQKANKDAEFLQFAEDEAFKSLL